MPSERVALFGGPFDGEYRDVDPARELLTIEWKECAMDRDWNGRLVHTTQLGLASYCRIGRHTFLHCRTPTKFGDRPADLMFPNQQMSLEEE